MIGRASVVRGAHPAASAAAVAFVVGMPGFAAVTFASSAVVAFAAAAVVVAGAADAFAYWVRPVGYLRRNRN